jgi:hypothetical protein
MPLVRENSQLYEVIKVGTISGQTLNTSISGVTPSGGALPVSDSGSSLTVDGRAFRAAVTITRPSNTTAYTAGDVVGSTSGSAIITLPSIGPSGGYVLFQSVRLLIGSTSVPSGMAAFRLHLYTATPTAIADNSPFDLLSSEVANYAGYIDLPAPQDLGSTLFTQADYCGTAIKLATASTSLFAELETRGAFTPASATVFDLRVMTLEAGL